MLPLAEALSKIHKLGVIHRDISPDNIMYLNQGICKLMDFGSARYFMQQDQELTSTVKRGYTPEEQYTSTGNQGPGQMSTDCAPPYINALQERLRLMPLIVCPMTV